MTYRCVLGDASLGRYALGRYVLRPYSCSLLNFLHRHIYSISGRTISKELWFSFLRVDDDFLHCFHVIPCQFPSIGTEVLKLRPHLGQFRFRFPIRRLLIGYDSTLRLFLLVFRWQDTAGKTQNSQIKLDMTSSVDKTCLQIEQAWLSDFSPDISIFYSFPIKFSFKNLELKTYLSCLRFDEFVWN